MYARLIQQSTDRDSIGHLVLADRIGRQHVKNTIGATQVKTGHLQLRLRQLDHILGEQLIYCRQHEATQVGSTIVHVPSLVSTVLIFKRVGEPRFRE